VTLPLNLPGTGVRRWVVVAAVLLMAVVLGELGVVESQQQPRLGVDVAWQDGGLIVSNVEPVSLAWSDGVNVGDVVQLIDGVAPTGQEDVEHAASITVLGRSGVPITTTGPTPASPLVVPTFLATAVLFLLVGSLVFVVASEVIPATVVLSATVVAALMFIGSIASLSGARWAAVVTFLGLIGFGATLFLLTLVFPINRLGSRLGRWAALATCVIALALSAWYGFTVLSGGAYVAVRSITALAVALFLVSAAASVALAVLRPSPHRGGARRATVRVALGAVAGLAPFCALSIGPVALSGTYLVPPELTILSIVFLPATLAAALLSRQFPGVDRLVSRSLVALIVWLGLLGLYAVVLTATPYVPLVGTLGVSLATFPVLQARLRRRVERALFRDVYDPTELVREIGDELVRLHGLDAIANHVVSRVSEALDLTWVQLSLNGEAHPAGAVTTVTLAVEDEEIGSLAVGPKKSDIELLPSDVTFLETVRPLLSTVLLNALLVRRLEEQVDMLAERERALASLNMRLIQVQEEERRRLALDLHDDALQRVVLLGRGLSSTGRLSPDEILDAASDWREAAQDIAIALRAVCRDLRPPVIDDLGLGAALDWLVNEVRSRSELEVELRVEDIGRLQPDLEIALYRVAQEGLNNVRKHADASSVLVALEERAGTLRLSIADDGKGIAVVSDGQAADGAPSLGLLGMRERVAPFGGTIGIDSNRTGGTTVVAEVPVESSLPLAA
jgi:signal transduction histidine kinase